MAKILKKMPLWAVLLNYHLNLTGFCRIKRFVYFAVENSLNICEDSKVNKNNSNNNMTWDEYGSGFSSADSHEELEPVLLRSDLPESALRGVSSVAVDTEAMGLNIFWDRLCVVQLKFDNGRSFILQISKEGEYPVLSQMLQDESVVKIFHYGRFDITMMYKRFGVLAKNVFCTKIASKLARSYTNRHGLKSLCREIAGIELQKEQQSSDWGTTELSEAQKKYAISDVKYLHVIKDALVIRLIREERLEIAEKCFRFLPYRCYLDSVGCKDIFEWGNESD